MAKRTECQCFKKFNKAAQKDRNISLVSPFQFDFGARKVLPQRPTIAVEWHDKGKRKRGQTLPVVFPTYCPFCGKKYPE